MVVPFKMPYTSSMRLAAMHWVRGCSTGMPPPTLASKR